MQYENVDFLTNKQKKEFFTKFISRVVLYDNRIVIIYNTSKDPQNEMYFKDNDNNGQILEDNELSQILGEFEDKNKAGGNMISVPPQNNTTQITEDKAIKKDCREISLQSDFGGQ